MWIFAGAIIKFYCHVIVSLFAEKRFHYPGSKNRTSESEDHSAIGSYSNGPLVGKIRTQRFDGKNFLQN